MSCTIFSKDTFPWRQKVTSCFFSRAGFRIGDTPLTKALIQREGCVLFNNILTVCTGNICRSPMAEYLLRHRLEQAGNWQGRVCSAGISALVQQPAEEATVALMLSRNIDLGPHRACQLTRQQLRQADLVLVMEKHHRKSVLDLDPAARGKTFLLGHWNNSEIADPYRRSDEVHFKVLQSIEDGLKPWLEKMGIHN